MIHGVLRRCAHMFAHPVLRRCAKTYAHGEGKTSLKREYTLTHAPHRVERLTYVRSTYVWMRSIPKILTYPESNTKGDE